jgi:uncharacterized protein
MKILIDIGHPAHVHLFKHFAWRMKEKGHEILFTVRDKEYEIQLLTAYGFKFISFGKHYKSKFGKIYGLFKFDLRMMQVALSFKPDLFLSHGSIYAAQIAWLIGKPHISMEDSGNMEQIRVYRPFTKAILTPDVLPEMLGKKQIKYKAYHEIGYLLPKYYIPDDTIFEELKVNHNDKYCILRFVSWNATHDTGHRGFSDEQKILLVNLLSKYLKVFISSESELIDSLKVYKISIPPERMHDALYFASLFVGEGATMASESGVLGTTSVYVNSICRSYCQDQERFGLVYNFQEAGKSIEKIKELLSHKENLDKQFKYRNALLKEKIDLTAFLIWFVENFPASYRIMKENPDYQNKFK